MTTVAVNAVALDDIGPLNILEAGPELAAHRHSPYPALADALSRQLDLSVSRIDDGAIVYSNDAWIPRRAVVPASTAVAAKAGAGLETVERGDLASGVRAVSGRLRRSAPAGPGTLLWAEAANSGWHVRVAGRDATRTAAFDWTNAFVLPSHASVDLHYRAAVDAGIRYPSHDHWSLAPAQFPALALLCARLAVE